MNKSFKKFLGLTVAIIMIMSLMAACGGNDEPATDGGEPTPPAQTAALTEEEYLTAIDDLQTSMTNMETALNGVDQTDPEAVTKAIEDIKKPFEDAIAITPPEKYVDAHAKISDGCQAFVDYFDFTLEIMEDPAKASEAGDRIQTLMTDATTSFAEGLAMLEE